MAGKVEVVDEVEAAPGAPGGDPEKLRSRSAAHERIGDQIPHEMLEELAPNGEGEYILDKINNMTEEEAIAIVQESYKFHADDWNFPSEMRERMRRLLEGRKQYGEFYDRDLRIDAVMMRYSSPYPGVRAVAEVIDDSSVPIETIRAYFLGISWAVIGTFMASFFNSRFPSVSEFSRVCRACRAWMDTQLTGNRSAQRVGDPDPPISLCESTRVAAT
jgi:hypothetical protein